MNHRLLFISAINQELDFCRKERRPRSFVNPRHISEVFDKKLLEDTTVVKYCLKISMIVQITGGYNPEKL